MNASRSYHYNVSRLYRRRSEAFFNPALGNCLGKSIACNAFFKPRDHSCVILGIKDVPHFILFFFAHKLVFFYVLSRRMHLNGQIRIYVQKLKQQRKSAVIELYMSGYGGFVCFKQSCKRHSLKRTVCNCSHAVVTAGYFPRLADIGSGYFS